LQPQQLVRGYLPHDSNVRHMSTLPYTGNTAGGEDRLATQPEILVQIKSNVASLTIWDPHSEACFTRRCIS
jgi:hypothetical protein